MSPSPSAISTYEGLGLPRLAVRLDPGGTCFHHRVVGVVKYGRMNTPGMERHYPGVWRYLDAGPRGNHRRAPSLRALDKSAISTRGWGFHRLRGDTDPRVSVFVPGILVMK